MDKDYENKIRSLNAKLNILRRQAADFMLIADGSINTIKRRLYPVGIGFCNCGYKNRLYVYNDLYLCDRCMTFAIRKRLGFKVILGGKSVSKGDK